MDIQPIKPSPEPSQPEVSVADTPTNVQHIDVPEPPQPLLDPLATMTNVVTPAIPENIAGVPAAGRFDLSTVYPTVAEQHPPVAQQPDNQQNTTQPVPESSTQQQSTQTTPAPTSFAAFQQSDVQRIENAETVDVPMKNIFVVGIAGPFATIGLYAALYMLVTFLIFKLFSGGGVDSGGLSLLKFIANPGIQAAVLAGFLYLNIRVTATYFEDLKIPRPSMAALFSVLLVFSTVAIGIKNISGDGYYSILSGLGGSYFFVLLSLFSGLLWYPLSVKWSLSPVESTMKKVYPYIAGGIILIGIGLYLVALFNSSASQL